MEQLNINDRKSLSKTCRLLYRMTTKFRFGFVSPEWEAVNVGITNSNIIASNYRDGVWSNNIFYLVVFSKDQPIFWSLNLDARPITWTRIVLESPDSYEPVRYCAAAVITNSMYIFGGENIETEELSNVLYKLDMTSFKMVKIESSATPAPRKLHSLNAINSGRLVMFGGRCLMNGEMYDTQHFAIYDINNRCWSNIKSNNIPYRRASHSTIVLDEKLYIYGGQQINSSSASTETQIHDDKDIHLYDARQENWNKIIAPYPDGSRLSPTLTLPSDWIKTDGSKVGRRVHAAMFSMSQRIIILGGKERDNFRYENETNEGRPWELLKSLSLEE
ncbi:5594_t:CDS:1, partial [Cetraspora pellucida]